MIDASEKSLVEWIGEIVPRTKVLLEPPGKKGVCVYMLGAAPKAAARGPSRPPLQVQVRYLITAQDDDPAKAHRTIGTLLFAAMENPEFEVEDGEPSVELWRALGVAPQPAFVIRVVVRKERPERVAPLVRRPMDLRQGLIRPLTGQVMGPGGMPIMGAQVEVPALRLFAVTDSKGCFELDGLPSGADMKIRIRAKGQEFAVEAPENGHPLVIELKALKEA